MTQPDVAIQQLDDRRGVAHLRSQTLTVTSSSSGMVQDGRRSFGTTLMMAPVFSLMPLMIAPPLPSRAPT